MTRSYRGDEATMPPLYDGEFGWCHDTHELWIGSQDVGNFPLHPPAASSITGVVGVNQGGTGGTTSAQGLANLGGQPLDGDLTSLSQAGGTDTLYYRSGAETWAPVTVGQGLLFSNGTLTAVSTTEGTWDFSTATSMVDPGAGKLRINATTFMASTLLAISKLTGGGLDVTNLLQSLDAGDTIYIQDQSNSANWVRYSLTGVPVNNTSWFQIPIEPYTPTSSGGSSPNNNSPVLVQFTRTGAGSGAGHGGTETSVDVAGGNTGLTFTGGPVTISGVITM